MTTQPPMRATTQPRSSKRTMLSGILVALSIAATACASSDTDSGAVVEIGSNESSNGSLDGGGILNSDVTLESAAGVDSDRPPVDDDGPQYGDSFEPSAAPANVVLPGFEEVEWEDLIPPGFSSEQILARYEDRLTAAEPGSAELDDLYEEMNAEYEDASVNPQLNSVEIQLAGFVAPLTYDGDAITEFLLVPYFGACIHVPPPPVNQTVIVTLDEGDSLTLEESWGAVWVAGEMAVTSTDTDLATAGYSISGAQFGVYQSQ